LARILILQEKEEISSYWTDAFLELGYDVTVETGATSAWSAVQEQRFDLVIVDIFVRRKDQNFPEGGTLLLGRLRAKKLDAALDWMHHVPVGLGKASRNWGFNRGIPAFVGAKLRDAGAIVAFRQARATNPCLG